MCRFDHHWSPYDNLQLSIPWIVYWSIMFNSRKSWVLVVNLFCCIILNFLVLILLYPIYILHFVFSYFGVFSDWIYVQTSCIKIYFKNYSVYINWLLTFVNITQKNCYSLLSNQELIMYWWKKICLSFPFKPHPPQNGYKFFFYFTIQRCINWKKDLFHVFETCFWNNLYQ